MEEMEKRIKKLEEEAAWLRFKLEKLEAKPDEIHYHYALPEIKTVPQPKNPPFPFKFLIFPEKDGGQPPYPFNY